MGHQSKMHNILFYGYIYSHRDMNGGVMVAHVFKFPNAGMINIFLTRANAEKWKNTRNNVFRQSAFSHNSLPASGASPPSQDKCLNYICFFFFVVVPFLQMEKMGNSISVFVI